MRRRISIKNKTALKAIFYDYLTQDGGPGSGNFEHKGRPGQVGGYGGGGLTKVSGGGVHAKDYSLKNSRAGRSAKADRTFTSIGKPTKNLKKGSGTTKLAESDLSHGLHSCVKYIDKDGHLDPDREKLHADLVDKVFEGHKPVQEGEEKKFFILGGGPASGKSSLTNPKTHKNFGVPSIEEQATVNADDMKEQLPEYNIKNRDAAANFCHEESSALAKRAMQAGFDNGYNMTLDGTGDGSLKSLRSKIQAAREKGYKVEGAYVTVPTDMAVERAIKRGKKKGRVVPEEQIRRTHRDVSRIFPQVASEFDHVTLYDTSGPYGSKPTLIAECYRGQPIIVHDQKLYDAFLAKGEETW